MKMGMNGGDVSRKIEILVGKTDWRGKKSKILQRGENNFMFISFHYYETSPNVLDYMCAAAAPTNNVFLTFFSDCTMRRYS